MLRDRVAEVLAEWEPAFPGCASVLAIYVFGLEENGQYRRAEKSRVARWHSIPAIQGPFMSSPM